MQVSRETGLSIVKDGPNRFEQALTTFREQFGREPAVFVSAPGRCEIIGNHTDHNNGMVVAAAIDLDTLVLAAPSSDGRSRLVSRGWDVDFVMDPANDRRSDTNDTERLMRGVRDGLLRAGYDAPAYDAVLDSRVLPGSGLSSSAALEISLVGIHQALGSFDISEVERAQIGQYAENEYVGKPCGLMDQMAVSVGGSVAIDFSDVHTVNYQEIGLDFGRNHYQLAVVDTGGNHADLTDQYAAIPREMKALATYLNVKTLSQTSKQHLLVTLSDARRATGDRAILRGFHFFDEQERVAAVIEAVQNDQHESILSLMNQSGDSSWTLLQNIYPTHNDGDQSLAIGLTVTKEFLTDKNALGACRVHGGGFAGTILAVIPQGLFPQYRAVMDAVFGTHATQPLRIRQHGLIYGTV